MRISRQIPEEGPKLIEVDQKNKMFKWFNIKVETLGELQLHDWKVWVSDDGLKFASADDALEYFKRREAETVPDLPPGEYMAKSDDVSVRGGKIRIRLAKGKEIVIHTED